ncbi:zinc-dependent metalloprotease [Pseudonocardia sp. HH130630-07]|uniref:zinc-dependent metalloprotease n=1 Tax=Pseudonocardia sp. HH130630-07 TaxID=1690815 RepID=UPI000814CD85|nr:zinc-dependent metalloprotease [Pseudonocardia sp. HH130630-07]ANY05887.1 hydrolase [Pseudonocardia sp. HH130630-07]
MSDTPFGFGPADRDRDKDDSSGPGDGESGSGGSGRDPEGPRDPFGFGSHPASDDPAGRQSGAEQNPFAAFGMGGLPGMPGMPGGPGGNFDMGQLGQMLSQLGQMLSHAGPGSGGGPVNYDLAAQLATQQLAQTTSSLTDEQRTAVAEAVRLAELWLDPATSFPSAGGEVKAWTPSDWVRAGMPTWKRLCDPVANRLSAAWVEGLPEEIRAQAGPMLGMLGQMGGMAFGSQLGQGLAQLGKEVLTSTELGIPVGPERTAALLPEAIARFTEGLDRPAGEVTLYLAAREAAHQRLFAGAQWLRERLLGAVEDYARGITVDTSRIEELARGIDPSNPESIQEAMSSGMFEPEDTPEQKAALARLETLLALIEGWVDTVVDAALAERLPGSAAMRETMRRRRASGGPAEQAFATIVGLQLRPRRLRAAAELWQLLEQERGIEGRDAVWSHPDLIPVADDLDDPAAFVRGGSGGGVPDDPIAELERQMAADAEQKAEQQKAEDGEDEGEQGEDRRGS